jgi:hypothetical protein
MPQQLIYTSAPRGVIAGRSGHCTVARSAAMRDALMLQLEKLSYYQHLSLSGGLERPIYCCRVLDLRGSRYHVLTRIQDAGLDFTGRTNFLAHHLIFAPEEIRQFASPPIILRDWPGWVKSWNKDPELFENENWSSLATLSRASAPASHWQQLTGDAANGYGLLEARAGVAFRVDNLVDQQVLALFAESLELLELRDPRRDFRASAWQYTFTTSMQEQDNPADFRWRCLHSDNPAANRFAGPDTRALSEVRVSRVTNEEGLFARSGRQPPRFVVPPQNANCAPGETARLHAKAESMPVPIYQWFTVDRAGNSQPIPNANSEELVVPMPPLGVTRYAVRASNSEGQVTSDVVMLSVEPKGTRPTIAARPPASPPAAPPIKSQDEIDRQRQRLEAERGQGQKPKWPLILLGIVFLAAVGGAIALLPQGKKKSPVPVAVQRHDSNAEMSNLHVNQTNFATSTNENPIAHVPPEAKFATSSEPKMVATEPFTDGITQLPQPWKGIRIGKIGASTFARYNNSREQFLIYGAGENNYGPSDDVFFVQQPASNSVDFIARLTFADLIGISRHGLMIRESGKADAPFAFVGISQAKISCLRRDNAGLPITHIAKEGGLRLPIFLRLLKETNFISGAYSTNGSNWVWFETNQLPFLAQSYLIGFAVSSGNSENQVKSTFDKVTLGKH